MLNPAFPTMHVAYAAWSWLGVLLCSGGLVLLYWTTTADPGVLFWLGNTDKLFGALTRKQC